MSSDGYIYVKNWEKYQHPDAVRSSHMPWLKLYTNLLGDDDWLELCPADRVLHIGILMLTSRYGNGRIKGDSKWLCGQLKLDWSGRYRGLERLSQAGFIEILASKAASNTASKVASLEEKREKALTEPSLSQKENARASRAAETAARARPAETGWRQGHASFAALGPPTKNGDQPDAADIGRRRRVVKNNYDGVLLENGPELALEWLQENHPDLVTSIISQKPATKEPSA